MMIEIKSNTYGGRGARGFRSMASNVPPVNQWLTVSPSSSFFKKVRDLSARSVDVAKAGGLSGGKCGGDGRMSARRRMKDESEG